VVDLALPRLVNRPSVLCRHRCDPG
jgi:hypothetical protein